MVRSAKRALVAFVTLSALAAAAPLPPCASVRSSPRDSAAVIQEESRFGLMKLVDYVTDFFQTKAMSA